MCIRDRYGRFHVLTAGARAVMMEYPWRGNPVSYTHLLEYDNKRTREGHLIEAVERLEEKTGLELFEEFYELQNNSPMSERQRAFAGKLMEEMCIRDRYKPVWQGGRRRRTASPHRQSGRPLDW